MRKKEKILIIDFSDVLVKYKGKELHNKII